MNLCDANRARIWLAVSVVPLLAPLSRAQSYTADLLSYGPSGYWSLGINANDSSPNGENGNATGVLFTPLQSPSIGLGSASFSGGAQVILIPGAPALNFGAASTITAMAWVKTINQSFGSMFVLGKMFTSTNNNTGWGIGIDNGDYGAPQGSGRFYFGFLNLGKPLLIVESNAAVNDGNWHFLVAVYDGSSHANGVTLYIDGAPATVSVMADALGAASGLNESPVSIGNLMDGSNPYEGNIAGAALFHRDVTPQQISQLAQDAGTSGAILSQFAFGDGWYSAVYFANTSSGTVSFPVTFTSDDGSPLTIPALGGGITTVTLAPGASRIIEGIGSGNLQFTLQQGYVTARLPVGVTGYAVFRQSVKGIADQEAVVPFTGIGGGTQTLLYDDTNGLVTALAIVNFTPLTATVAISVTGSDGNVIGSAALRPLAAFNKTEANLHDLVAGVTGTRGTITISSSTGAVNAIGIRFLGAAFASIPALNTRQLGQFIGQ